VRVGQVVGDGACGLQIQQIVDAVTLTCCVTLADEGSPAAPAGR
jgi:hypothetical protein